MNQKQWIAIVLPVVLTLFCALGAGGVSAAKKDPAPAITPDSKGFCCFAGQIAPAKKRECDARRGSFFLEKGQAEKSCRSLGSPNTQTRPATGMSVSPGAVGPAGAGSVSGRLPAASNNSVPLGGTSLHVLTPAGGERFYRGETIDVVLAFSTTTPMTGNIDLTLMNRAGLEGGTASVPPNTRSARLTIRANAPLGEYFVVASHGTNLRSESRIFTVHDNSGRIEIIRPGGREVLHPGGSMEVVYRFDRRVEPGPVTFELSRSGKPGTTRIGEYRPSQPSRSEQPHSFRWSVPPGVAEGRYAITATHPRATGSSMPIKVRSIGDSGGTNYPFDLTLLDFYREMDSRGRLIARVSASSGFNPGGLVDFNLLSSSTSSTSTVIQAIGRGPSETSVVVGEMGGPGLAIDKVNLCNGREYTVTMDPEDAMPETDEGNNALTKRFFYWDDLKIGFFHDLKGELVVSGRETRIACDERLRNKAMHFYVWNCGKAERIGSDIHVRQFGRRRFGRELGERPFDEEIRTEIYYAPNTACAVLNPSMSGREGCMIVRIPMDNIHHVDSRLIITGGPLTEAYGVKVNFGERVNPGTGTLGLICVYD